MKSLHLFAGIGGCALGFQRAGITPTALVEIDGWRRSVLKRHWPDAQIHDDVQTFRGDMLEQPVDIITGGFPCQDISYANRTATGLEGSRSRLWYEQLRIVDEVRPRYVLTENSSALRSRGLDTVLRGLDAIGYDAERHCIPASFLGAWHKRDRVWLLAYARGVVRCEGLTEGPLLRQSDLSQPLAGVPAQWPGRSGLPASRFCRTVDGVPERTQRLQALGNSVYTPIPEMTARIILQRELFA